MIFNALSDNHWERRQSFTHTSGEIPVRASAQSKCSATYSNTHGNSFHHRQEKRLVYTASLGMEILPSDQRNVKISKKGHESLLTASPRIDTFAAHHPIKVESVYYRSRCMKHVPASSRFRTGNKRHLHCPLISYYSRSRGPLTSPDSRPVVLTADFTQVLPFRVKLVRRCSHCGQSDHRMTILFMRQGLP